VPQGRTQQPKARGSIAASEMLGQANSGMCYTLMPTSADGRATPADRNCRLR
jgi:hypothetical protein